MDGPYSVNEHNRYVVHLQNVIFHLIFNRVVNAKLWFFNILSNLQGGPRGLVG